MASSETQPSVSFRSDKAIAKALKTAAQVAPPSRTSKLVVQSIKLSVHDDVLTIDATDLYGVWYHHNLIVTGLNTGSPFTVLMSRADAAGVKASMSIILDKEFYSIDGVRSAPDHQVQEFPAPPALSDPVKVSVDSTYFADLAACALSTAESEVRPLLQTIRHRGSTLVATDSHRILEARSITWSGELLVPAKHAGLLAKTFADPAVPLQYDGRWAQYGTADFHILVRLQDGKYPDTSRIWPPSARTDGVIPSIEPWVAACDKVLRIHSRPKKKERDVNLTSRLQFKPNTVTLFARNTEGQEYTADLPFELRGEPLTLQCNAQYLRDALTQIGDGARIWLTSATSGFTLESQDRRRRALVLPIRVVNS